MLALVLAATLAQEDPLRDFWEPIDLELENVEPREAFDRLFDATGLCPMDTSGLRGEPITLRLKGASYWQALDALCRAHGGINYPKRMFTDDLESRRWVDVPTVYRGPLRLHVYDTARVREIRYPDRADRTEVTIVAQWLPSFAQKPGEFVITKAEDSDGTSLLPMVKVDPGFDLAADHRAAAWLFPLRPTRAKSIRRLEATWTLTCLDRLQEVRFEKPAKSVGAAKDVGPIRVELSDYQMEHGTHQFSIRLSFGPAKVSKEWKDSLEVVPLASRMALRVGVDGKKRLVWKSGEGADHVEFKTFGLQAVPEEIVVRVGADLRTVEIPFVFENVPLPEDGR